jgi:hypothetical protein
MLREYFIIFLAMAVLATLWNVAHRTPHPRSYVQWWKKPVVNTTNTSHQPREFNFTESEQYLHEMVMFHVIVNS